MKNVPLISVLSLCGLAFLGGSGLAVKTVLENSTLEDKIDKKQKEIRVLSGVESGKKKKKSRGKTKEDDSQSGKLALSEENLERGRTTLKALKKAAEARVGMLLQPKRLDAIFQGDGTSFKSKLTEKSSEWTKLCEEEKIGLASSGFGFSRYLGKNEMLPEDKLKQLDVEANVTGELLALLAKSREDYESALKKANVMALSETTFLKILGIEREAVELNSTQLRALEKDEFSVKPVENAGATGLCVLTDGAGKEIKYESLRRDGVVNAVALRIRFVGDSGVLREFMKKLENYSIFVRDVKASRATADLLPQANVPAFGGNAATATGLAPASSPFDLFGGSAVAPAAAQPVAARVPARRVIVKDVPEVFSVTLEYVTPVAAPKKDEKTENGGKSE